MESATIKPDFAASTRHFIFTEEHEQLRETIERFAKTELAPHADEWEETTFPDSVIKRMGDLGFLGLTMPEEYGGQGGDYFTSVVRAEAMAYSNSGGLNMGIAVQTDMAMPPIAEVRQRGDQAEVPEAARSPATSSSPSASPSPTPDPTSPRSRPAPCATATTT